MYSTVDSQYIELANAPIFVRHSESLIQRNFLYIEQMQKMKKVRYRESLFP
jgi:hypothetical protein